jgi:hypothetical protein
MFFLNMFKILIISFRPRPLDLPLDFTYFLFKGDLHKLLSDMISSRLSLSF